jgi:hypothetical protein
VSLKDIIEKFREKVFFIPIYIREAHPVDGWWLGKGVAGKMIKVYTVKAATDVYDPQTIDERRAVAGRCENAVGYGIRTYVDDMDDAVNHAYAAWPTRLYLVGSDGTVVYRGGLGPFGFHPERLGEAIAEYLANR